MSEIEKYILDLKEKWKPKTQESFYYDKYDKKKHCIDYWDNTKCEYTIEMFAFHSYVNEKVSDVIRNLKIV